MSTLVGLSTSSVYPEGTATAFQMAADLGYDGVEVMVGTDAPSQDSYALLDLMQTHQVPVLSIHSPCLLVTQRVWGTEPWGKLRRAQAVAEQLGAGTVVVHPPFRWQRGYAQGFVDGLARMRDETQIRFAVENMFPWRALSQEITVAHLHLADGTPSARDEHLIPGRGTPPVAEVLSHLAATGFAGNVIVEVNTRSAANADARSADLREALAFAREHGTPMAG